MKDNEPDWRQRGWARSQLTTKPDILLSIGMKLAFVALAVAGLATLWMAVVADLGMLIVVALNGMRPLRLK